mmetsp:Transcript_46260/g.115073  ORF Transcript_46260/g.115073 Transcript_46260/m.115073 type:complete len:219 (-) Transcript_46260:102-758(-)
MPTKANTTMAIVMAHRHSLTVTPPWQWPCPLPHSTTAVPGPAVGLLGSCTFVQSSSWWSVLLFIKSRGRAAAAAAAACGEASVGMLRLDLARRRSSRASACRSAATVPEGTTSSPPTASRWPSPLPPSCPSCSCCSSRCCCCGSSSSSCSSDSASQNDVCLDGCPCADTYPSESPTSLPRTTFLPCCCFLALTGGRGARPMTLCGGMRHTTLPRRPSS